MFIISDPFPESYAGTAELIQIIADYDPSPAMSAYIADPIRKYQNKNPSIPSPIICCQFDKCKM